MVYIHLKKYKASIEPIVGTRSVGSRSVDFDDWNNTWTTFETPKWRCCVFQLIISNFEIKTLVLFPVGCILIL